MGSDITPMTTCDYTKLGLNLRKRSADAGIDHTYAESAMNEVLQWYGYERRDEIEPDHRRSKSVRLETLSDGEREMEEAFIAEEEIESQPVEEINQIRDSSTVIIKHEPSDDARSVELADGQSWRCQVIVKNEIQSPEMDECKDCSWCGKSLMYSDSTVPATTGARYCSETCFAQSRRASFKRAKICDWCRHVRHTVSQEEFQGAGSGLQFCSDKCVNQYKMHVFCRETQTQLEQHPHLRATLEQTSSLKSGSKNKEGLITPDLWLHDCRDHSSSPLIDESADSSSPLHTQQIQNTGNMSELLPNAKPIKLSDMRRTDNQTSVITSPSNVPQRTQKSRESKRRKCTVNNIPISDGNVRSMTPASTCSMLVTAPVPGNSSESTSIPNPAAHFTSTTAAPYTPRVALGAENTIPASYSGVQIQPPHHPKGPVRAHNPPRRPQIPPRYGMYQPMAGPPPVTVLVPYPVVIPIPMPIPIPIPLPFEEFVKAFARDTATSSVSAENVDEDSFSENAIQVGPLDCTTKKNNHNTSEQESTLKPHLITFPEVQANDQQSVIEMTTTRILQKKSRRRRRLLKQSTD